MVTWPVLLLPVRRARASQTALEAADVLRGSQVRQRAIPKADPRVDLDRDPVRLVAVRPGHRVDRAPRVLAVRPPAGSRLGVGAAVRAPVRPDPRVERLRVDPLRVERVQARVRVHHLDPALRRDRARAQVHGRVHRIEPVPAARVDLQVVLIDLVPEVLRALGLAAVAMTAPHAAQRAKTAGPMVRHLKPRAHGAVSLDGVPVPQLVVES